MKRFFLSIIIASIALAGSSQTILSPAPTFWDIQNKFERSSLGQDPNADGEEKHFRS
jgi:hypothetical protein